MEFAASIEIWFDQENEGDAIAYLKGIDAQLRAMPSVSSVEISVPEEV